MDSTALFSGVVGAAIGSLSSVATLYVQNTFQNRRAAQRLLFETAYKDYELRILHLPEHRTAFPVILAYHKKMFEMIESGHLTPSAAKEIMETQGEMARAVYEAAGYYRPDSQPNSDTTANPNTVAKSHRAAAHRQS
jgi:hypothetical protein